MEYLQRIKIGVHDYPVKIDLCVLEKIQEDYGSINEWERDILGIGFVTDDEGHVVIGEDNKPLAYSKEPSVKAIRAVLSLMINEGLEIEAEQMGVEWKPVSKALIDRECTTDYKVLAEIVHKEFSRCFVVKK